MTNISNFVSTEPTRILETLAKTDPTTDAYGTGLQNLAFLMDVIPNFDSVVQDTQSAAESKVLNFKSLTVPDPGPVVVDQLPGFVDDELSAKSETAEEQEVHTPAPGGDDKDIPSKEFVRERLAFLSNQHTSLDVAALMAEMGYSKLSDIPKEKYNVLLERAEAAVKGDA